MKIVINNVAFDYNIGCRLLKSKYKNEPFGNLGDIWEDIVPITFKEIATEYQIKDAEGEENDWFNYTTDMEEANNNSRVEDYEYDENNPTLIVDNAIAVHINKSFTIFKAD